MEINRTPQAKSWAFPAMISVTLFIVSLMRSVEPTLGTYIMLGVASVMAGWALISFGEHLGHVIASIKAEETNAKYMVSETRFIESIGQLNEKQIALARMFGGHVIETFPGRDDHGPVEKLWGAQVYLYFAWYVLKMSDDKSVYPISNFFAQTYHFDMLQDHEIDDLTQAREFGAWLIRYGYATWHNGNKSASWVNGNSRARALRNLGLTLTSYEPDVPESE